MGRTSSVNKKQFITRVNKLQSVEEAALELGVPRSTAFNWNARYQELGEAFFVREEIAQVTPELKNIDQVIAEAYNHCIELINRESNNPDILHQIREYVLEVTKPYNEPQKVQDAINVLENLAKNMLQLTGDLNTMQLVVDVANHLDNYKSNQK